MIVADTDVIIDFFENISPAAEAVASLILAEELAVTVISTFELCSGVTDIHQDKALEAFFKNCTILFLTHKEALLAGKLYNDLKKRGQLISNNDILIAAQCKAHGLPLFTRNTSHFKRIHDLRIFTAEGILGGRLE